MGGELDAAPIDYRAADLAAGLDDLGRFDVIVGRRILMYLPDASGTLARVLQLFLCIGVFMTGYGTRLRPKAAM